ncbi:PspC domain-containing protein [Xylanibacter brevis]|uniref:PspC domain-containing protein n=1 Tax=Xylanibacter brevis TaxID=83231 RepID=UPI0009DEA971|nr:PspC domain-containing protein [Xylanibacter brevis]
MTRKLYRGDDRILGGVCSGLAEYLDLDPVLVRLGYAALTLFTAFCGLIFYVVAWIVIPERPIR